MAMSSMHVAIKSGASDALSAVDDIHSFAQSVQPKGTAVVVP